MTDYRKRKKIFQKLIRACDEQDIYSVPMICSKMNVSYEQIKLWAQKDKQCAMVLQTCHELCLGNIDMAGLVKRLSIKEAIQLLNENPIHC